jgi:hypothetical protein
MKILTFYVILFLCMLGFVVYRAATGFLKSAAPKPTSHLTSLIIDGKPVRVIGKCMGSDSDGQMLFHADTRDWWVTCESVSSGNPMNIMVLATPVIGGQPVKVIDTHTPGFLQRQVNNPGDYLVNVLAFGAQWEVTAYESIP